MKKQKETIGFVLRESNLSDNPDYYAGRPIGFGDITAEKILTVSQNIKKHIGEKEQQVFNQMVFDLPTLKGSTFIQYTIRLQIVGIEDGWWWDKKDFFNHYDPELLKLPICQTTERIKEEFKKILLEKEIIKGP